MHEWESLSHVRWDCKYHIVIVPKYRQKVLYGKLKRDLGEILRDLCRQKGVDLLDALIGATAIAYGNPILTGNDNHYKIMNDLQIKEFRP